MKFSHIQTLVLAKHCPCILVMFNHHLHVTIQTSQHKSFQHPFCTNQPLLRFSQSLTQPISLVVCQTTNFCQTFFTMESNNCHDYVRFLLCCCEKNEHKLFLFKEHCKLMAWKSCTTEFTLILLPVGL